MMSSMDSIEELFRGGVSLTEAVGHWLGHLLEMGRLEMADVARVAAVIGLASSVEDQPYNAALWGQFLKAVEGLSDGISDGGADPVKELAAELAALSAEIPDTPEG
jgi:hypothetical protein